MAKRRWIQRALGVKRRRVRGHLRVVSRRRGALHRQLGIPMGTKIPTALLRKYQHAPGKLGRRVRLALTLRRLKRR